MTKGAPVLSIALLTLARCLFAEITAEVHRSPDAGAELRVERTSDAPDLTVSLSRNRTELWSKKLGSKPDEKVSVWWRPDSFAVLIEHIDDKKQCRLSVVEFGKEHLRVLAVPDEELRNVQAVQRESVTWERDGSITFVVQTKTGKAQRKIAWTCHLVPIEPER